MTRSAAALTRFAAGAALAAGCAAAFAGHAQGPAHADIVSFAEVEPEISFPTCVGLARIEHGASTAIPIEETAVWDEAFDNLGESVGRTVALLRANSDDPDAVTAQLRAKAEQAGVDFLIMYEVAYDDGAEPAPIGKLRVFPTFEGEDPASPGRAAGAAALMDVADGRMYGVSSAVATDSELEQPGEDTHGVDPREDAFRAVAIELAHEVETAFVGLMIKAGLPAPQPDLDARPQDLTEAELIAAADRNAAIAYGEAAGLPGC